MRVMGPSMMLYAAYASLLYLVAYAAEIYLTYLHPGTSIVPVYWLEVLLAIVVYAGWLEAGRRFKNQLLANVSAVAIWLVPAAGVLSIVLGSAGSMISLYTIVSNFVMGLLVLFFGLALLRLRGRFGDLARVTGWLDIVIGLCMLSFILTPVAAILMPPVIVLEAVLLYSAYEKARRKGPLGLSGIFHKIF
jgi:hypothetical protein